MLSPIGWNGNSIPTNSKFRSDRNRMFHVQYHLTHDQPEILVCFDTIHKIKNKNIFKYTINHIIKN